MKAALAMLPLAVLGLSAAFPRAAHAQQTLYVANNGNNTVEKFTPGGVASQFASVQTDIEGLAFSSAGNLYAASYGSNSITEFTPGGIASTFATTGLNQPGGLAFAPAVTPEPSQTAALGLGVLGLAGLALTARRRRASA